MSLAARRGLTLAGIVLAAAALWGSLGQQIEVPTVFGDELIHWDASRSLAAGDGLRVRDGGYGFGPVYPVLLAPVHLLTADDLTAYRWARLWNARPLRPRRDPRLPSRATPPSTGLEPRVRGARGRDPVRALHRLRDDRGRGVRGVHARAARARRAASSGRRSRRSSARSRARPRGRRPAPARGAWRRVRRRPRRSIRPRDARPARCRRAATSGVSWPLVLVLGAGASRSACGCARQPARRLRGPVALLRRCPRRPLVLAVLAGLAVYLALVPLVVAPSALGGALRATPARERRGGIVRRLVPLASTPSCCSSWAPSPAPSSASASSTTATCSMSSRSGSSRRPVGGPQRRCRSDRRPRRRRAPRARPLATLPTYLLNATAAAASTRSPARCRRSSRTASRPRPRPRAGRSSPRHSSPWSSRSPSRDCRAGSSSSPSPPCSRSTARFAWDARIDVARNTTFAPMNAATTAWVDRAVPDGQRSRPWPAACPSRRATRSG